MAGPILVLDCYDSFVHTLARYAREAGAETVVVRQDAIDVAEAARFAGILLSPGPGRPEDAGIAVPLVRAATDTPILGVCLGHQAVALAYGGAVVRTEPMHGRACAVRHDGSALFTGLPNPFAAARYHSLLAEPGPILRVTARTDDARAVPMAVSHPDRPHYGVQFHPESLLTEGGARLVRNFVESVR